ncbi:hypothetical protein [Streptomyces sp. NPDC058757]|uniref:hypothetical protein n=1 Tax=unclassified Streptomyces TaxID=2593676 RepID=UPI003689C2D7
MTAMDQPLSDIESLLESVTGGVADWTVHSFSSGAVSIDIRLEGRVAVVDGVPSLGEWGVSFDVPEHEGFTGHEHIFSTPEEVLRFSWSNLSRP